jgi:uncharacterized protein
MAMIIDAFSLARNAESIRGEVALADLSRLDLLDRVGALEFILTGYIGSQQRSFLHLTVSGTLSLRCQRCLEPMDWPVALDVTVWLARSEAEADAAPVDEDEFDPVVGSESFDVYGLIEDEILLALPPTPKHKSCPELLVVPKDLTASPFAALKGLKRDD